MQLNEFLERFGARMGQIDAMNKENIDGYSFPEALQNFADKLCEKQRDNCRKVLEREGKLSAIHCDESIMLLEAEQPKIEEL